MFRNPVAHMTLSCPGWEEFLRIPSSLSYLHDVSSAKGNIRLLITFQSWQELRRKNEGRKVRERSNPLGVGVLGLYSQNWGGGAGRPGRVEEENSCNQ